MLIDWFTVAAQALNFIVLVWLLQRFLYKPILAAIDAREQKIAAELAGAASQQAEARKARDEFNDKNKMFMEQRAKMMADATGEAHKERDKLLQEGRRDADDLAAKQQAARRAESTAIIDRMIRLATAEVFSIAGKSLNDLASAEFEERLGSVFAQRLRQLSAEAKGLLGIALTHPQAHPVLRTRFALGDEAKAGLGNAVNETFSADIRMSFETVPDSDCGIELIAGGQRLAWGIQDYLKSFREKAEALMAVPVKAETPLARAS